MATIQRALISVSDKEGLVDFATQLNQRGIELIATGGTADLLQKNNIPTLPISEYTGFPEIMNGRVKTLHPKIYGGLLGRRGKDDAVMQQQEILPIDLLVVNLYPFAATIAKENCRMDEAIEQIDIGGPAMLRAAAKNFQDVTVVVDPKDYSEVLQAIDEKQATPLTLRQRLAQKVFMHTSEYDRMIANYLQNDTQEFPAIYQPQFNLQQTLRYGENPHQKAAFYRLPEKNHGTLATANLLQGKQLSYNNMIDADCALSLVRSLDPQKSACVIIKHATPCGVAQGDNPLEAYQKAHSSDSESAFGSTIAFNQCLDEPLANALKSLFVEVILAPAIDPQAKDLLAKKPNLRVLIYNKKKPIKTYAHHSISGGLLLQEEDQCNISVEDFSIVTQRQPSDNEMQNLLFAWRVVKFTKSNAIVFANNEMTLGIGCGQTSRVFATRIAVLRAQAANLTLENSVLASDAFFPFADSIQVAAEQKVSAIIQPGGSKRDLEVIEAADAANIAMVFTGIRHFRH